MKRLRRLGIFLAFLAVLGAGTALLFWDLGTECVSVLRTGLGRGDYLLTASDAEGNVYALGRDAKGFRVVQGSQMGRREAVWKLPPEQLPPAGRPVLLYPASGDVLYLGLYYQEEKDAALRLYRVTDRGRAVELLLSEPCAGGSFQEQMDSVRLSDFSQTNGVVMFAVIRGQGAQFYETWRGGNSLEDAGESNLSGLKRAIVLPDRTRILATDESLIRVGLPPILLENDESILQFNQAGTGLYYVDAAGLRVFYVDFAGWRPYSYMRLEKDAYDLDGVTDLRVTRDGNVLLLLEGRRLVLDRGSSVSDLSGMLYRSPGMSAAILAAMALGALLAALLLWYVVSEQRRLAIPLLLGWGLPVAAVAALAAGGLLRFAVLPSIQQAAAREAASVLGSAAAQTVREHALTQADTPERLSKALADMGIYREIQAAAYTRSDGGVWTVLSGGFGLKAGSRAELSACFDRDSAEQALETGAAFRAVKAGGKTRYAIYRAADGRVLAAEVDGSQLLRRVQENWKWMTYALAGLAVFLTALLFLALGSITRSMRRLLRGMERLSAGDRNVKVRINGGSELSSLAGGLNALSGALADMDRQNELLARSYRRFVPERVLSLLGKQNIAEVDKHTFVTRHLAAMILDFSFPQKVYERSGRELFDNINEIIERTAPIVAAKGGAIFNFAYNGYNAVFQGGSAAAVSTAVALQQEVLEINRERELSGRPQVSVHIALDEDDVALGVVGDENRLAPTSISSSFSAIQHLIQLCGRLEAGILCTEAIIDGSQGYASRYMGKCVQGGGAIRTYEIFDGDPYELRKVKEQTGQLFSEGVYALYGRDFARAKHIFLSLVHRNAGDGGARYYLYLADRLEKRPEAEISLDLEV